MKGDNLKNIFLAILSVLTICTFFFGFLFNENSAGAGGLLGDFKNTWKNLNTFINYDIFTALEFVKNADREQYISSRTPVLYILNAKLNPFNYSPEAFIKSIFVFSLIGYLIFYKLLITLHKNSNKYLIFLLSTCILLSPYYRTSSYWAGEENYGIISSIIALYFFYKFDNFFNKKIYLFLTIFFSSLCVYLDQKLIIIPILIFLNIFLNKNINYKVKTFTIINYIIFSLPFIYFILSWKSILPSLDSGRRGVGELIFVHHPMYVTTILGFYIFPILFFIRDNLKDRIKIFLSNKTCIILMFLYLIYLILLSYFNNLNTDSTVGKGAVFKLLILIFNEKLIHQTIIQFLSFASFAMILIFCINNLKNFVLFAFFIISSISIYPIFQEYFDPILFIIFFTYLFDKTNLKINYFNTIFLWVYNCAFLIFAFAYYN